MMAEIQAVDPGGLQAATDAVEAAHRDHFGSGPFNVELAALIVETERN